MFITISTAPPSLRLVKSKKHQNDEKSFISAQFPSEIMDMQLMIEKIKWKKVTKFPKENQFEVG